MNRVVPSALRMATDLGASSPSTMCRMVMARNDTVRLTDETSFGLSVSPPRRGRMIQANAGSPIQPRARLARVMPSWVAER